MGKAFNVYIARWAVITLSIVLLVVCRFLAEGVAQGTTGSASEQKLAEVARQIAGRESKPAEKVFKNIQRLQGIEAARLLRAMNSWSRALDVSCTHCHVVDQWEKDDKTAKQTARQAILF